MYAPGVSWIGRTGLAMNSHRLVLSLVLSVAIASGVSAQNPKREAPVIRQADRILIESGDPKALFDIFSVDLQLPEAWPLAENQGYVSGGLGAGNVNLEFYRYAPRKSDAAREAAKARYSGLALEPYPLSEALPELKARGISYSSPEPYVSALPNGTQGALWTLVPLPSFSKPGVSIFLYEYSPAFLKVDIRRKQLGNRLILNNGGPLGIQSVREIVIAAANLEKDKTAWRRLLGEPTPAGNWIMSAGPAIRLVQGAEDRIQKIIFQAKSLDQAKTFLIKKRMLGTVSAREISLSPSRVQRLNISLVQ
jgi:hypothetical protein